MKKVLWLSRHEPDSEQVVKLEKLFDEELEIVVQEKHIMYAAQVKELMDQHGCGEVVAVLPMDIVAELTRMGVYPLRAVMTRHTLFDGSVRFKFSHYERVRSIEVDTYGV